MGRPVTRVPVRVWRSWCVPPGFAAWVPLPRLILVAHSELLHPEQLAHELRHVIQAERYGVWWPFAYLAQWLAAGRRYDAMPFELEADAAMNDPWYLAWGSAVMIP